MLLKKPYALLIKHFKLLHFILAVFTIYSILKMNRLLVFFNNYLNVQNNMVGQSIRDNLYYSLMFFVPIVIFFISATLLLLMIKKKKPFRFYLFNTFVYIGILAIYVYVYIYLGRMEIRIVDIIGVRAIRDTLIIGIIVQSISLIIDFVRATGFDIKSFEFKSDLQQLEISEEDLEEYELDFSFDSNDRKRRMKRKIRFLKYEYKENKFLINLILLVIAFISIYFLQSKFSMYSKINKEGTIISDNNYSFSIEESYLTNVGENGLKITDDYLVIAKIKIKSKSNMRYLLMSNFVLEIGDKRYPATTDFNANLVDLGIPYNSNILSNDYSTYLLTFIIPKDNKESRINLLYLTVKGNIKIRLKPQTYEVTEKKYNLGDLIEIDNKTRIQINSYQLRDRFEINYDFCIKNSCYNSIQYLVPQLDSNYDKTILKINGFLVYDEGSNYLNLDQVMTNNAVLYYAQNGIIKSSYLVPVVNIKNKEDNIFYYEVNKEIVNADQIELVFSTRKCKYSYLFK